MQTLTAPELKTLMDSGNVILFDIRGEDEFAQEHIPGAVLLPADQIDANVGSIAGNREAVFYCMSGVRTRTAAKAIENAGINNPGILNGGLNAWRDNGFPVVTLQGGSGKISIARQVQLTVGLVIILLSAAILTGRPQIAYATMAVGAGLTFAGLTGSCTLARLLMLMPWNRSAG